MNYLIATALLIASNNAQCNRELNKAWLLLDASQRALVEDEETSKRTWEAYQRQLEVAKRACNISVTKEESKKQ